MLAIHVALCGLDRKEGDSDAIDVGRALLALRERRRLAPRLARLIADLAVVETAISIAGLARIATRPARSPSPETTTS